MLFQGDLIKCLEFGLLTKSGCICVHALRVCCMEVESVMMKMISGILTTLSRIRANKNMALPLLMFLSCMYIYSLCTFTLYIYSVYLLCILYSVYLLCMYIYSVYLLCISTLYTLLCISTLYIYSVCMSALYIYCISTLYVYLLCVSTLYIYSVCIYFHRFSAFAKALSQLQR